MTLNRHLFHDAHVRRFIVTHDLRGWDVIEEDDSTVLRHVHGRNWQRVEQEIRRFKTTADELKLRGWTEH
jgi:hypothetical protein